MMNSLALARKKSPPKTWRDLTGLTFNFVVLGKI
jgi:hypothetical protein